MNKNLLKTFLVLSFLFVLFTIKLINTQIAYTQAPDLFGIGEELLGNEAGFEGLQLESNVNPRASTIYIINLVLSFLGLVAIIIVIVGGFKWMTSSGNPEKVGSAKKLLIAGLIGLAIILLSWGLATWVFNSIKEF